MSQPEILPYTPQDKTEVIRMMRALREYLIPLNPDRLSTIPEEYFNKYFEKVLREMADGQRKIFVAKQDNKLVGYVNGVIHKGDEINQLQFKPGKVGEVIDVYVSAQYRGKGIGKKLLDAMRAYFKEKGCTTMSLSALTSNGSSIQFYHDYGFEDKVLELNLSL